MSFRHPAGHAEIARLLGVSRPTLHAILTERAPVTPEMALRLRKLCGNGPELWVALQARYDQEWLRETKRQEIDAIPTLSAEQQAAQVVLAFRTIQTMQQTPPFRCPVDLQPTDLIRGESRYPLPPWAPAFAGEAGLSDVLGCLVNRGSHLKD